jgi:hypothetical protein
LRRVFKYDLPTFLRQLDVYLSTIIFTDDHEKRIILKEKLDYIKWMNQTRASTPPIIWLLISLDLTVI